MEGKRQPNKYLDDKICEEFQSSLDREKIKRLWHSFREAGNSTEGRIQKSNFKKVFNKYGDKNDQFLDNLFERFKIDKTLEGKNDKEEVDLQDLVVSLAVLARIPYEEKLKFIFELADVDEDGCLSVDEIYKMIIRIERNFSKQNSFANVESASLLYEISMRRAQRTYRQIMQLLKSNNEIKQDGLITCDQYIEALRKSEELFDKQKFLPSTFSLSQILKNVPSQLSLQINDYSKQDFLEFRKEIYNILKNGNFEGNAIRYPGKVQIVRDQKVIEIIQPIEKKEKNPQKKANISKPDAPKVKNLPAKVNKPEIIQVGKPDDKRDYTEQKNQQQTIEVYLEKLKKMREIKMDPRLNIQFDAVTRQ